MLPPSYLDQMPDAFVKLWQQVEDEILQDVARRIGKMDTVTYTANWQLWRYQQTDALREDVIKLLAKYSGKSGKMRSTTTTISSRRPSRRAPP